MSEDLCPLGEGCDLLIAYKHGVSSAKDIIVQLEADKSTFASLLEASEAENADLREALERPLLPFAGRIEALTAERDNLLSSRDESWTVWRDKALEIQAERDKLRDIARQAICVIDSVQKYEQPRDPTEENALTMCEHEVFDFDVDAARTGLGETEND